MVVGMIASAAVFLIIVQMTWDEATRQRPTASLLVIAAGTSIPMASWMLHRGMGRRNTAKMAAAMLLPVSPFLGLVWLGITESALFGPYCISAIVAMLALMLHRRSHYASARRNRSAVAPALVTADGRTHTIGDLQG